MTSRAPRRIWAGSHVPLATAFADYIDWIRAHES